MRTRVKPSVPWIARARYEMEHEDELLLVNLMLLRLYRYIKDVSKSKYEQQLEFGHIDRDRSGDWPVGEQMPR